MKFSYLQEIPSSREMISAFGGYNHNIRIGEGEFYDMANLTSSEYPSLSPRKQRGIYKSTQEALGIIAKDKLCYVERVTRDDQQNTQICYLYIDNNRVRVPHFEIGEDGSYENVGKDFELEPKTEKTLVSMGAYLIILPDKKYINTVSQNDYGQYTDTGEINKTKVLNTGNLYFKLCRKDGTFYSQPSVLGDYHVKEQPVAPTAEDYNLEELPNETYWMDTSGRDPVLKVFSSSSGSWTVISSTYVKLSGPEKAFEDFSEGDGFTISGISHVDLKAFNGNYVIEKKQGEEAIIIKGFVSTTDQYVVDLSEDPITISRGMPDLDFIVESENRLWGCRYGLVNGKMVNEIRASKLGDFKNWECFAGISTDSYVASVGTDGPFTGAISYFGQPIFFKEDCIHKIYGSYPSNYQIQTIACRGVQKGSEKSLAIVNETLFYKSRNGVCAYEGSMPTEISAALGNVRYTEAVGGSVGNKYYVSMRDATEQSPQLQYKLFVYDTARGMWHKEDNTQAVQFCRYQDNLYYIDKDDGSIRIIEALPGARDGEIEPDAVKWSAESGILGTGTADKKYVSRLTVRLSLTYDSRITFYAEYDSSGIWEPLYTADGTSVKTISVPVRVKRCDHFRLRIEGKGMAQVLSIAKTIVEGSDL